MKTKADGSEWSKWRWLKAGKAYLNRSDLPLLSAYAYMQYAEHGSCLELVKGGLQLARTPAAPEPTSIHFLQWTRVYTFVHCIPI